MAFRFHKEDKIRSPILDLGIVLDASISEAIGNVVDCMESRLEAVWNIYGDSFTRKKVGDVLLDEVSRVSVNELSIKGGPASGLSGRRKDSLDDESACDASWNFHFIVKKLLDRQVHDIVIVRDRVLLLQVIDIIYADGGKAKNLLCSSQGLNCSSIRSK